MAFIWNTSKSTDTFVENIRFHSIYDPTRKLHRFWTDLIKCCICNDRTRHWRKAR
jgi:hypothetical protein